MFSVASSQGIIRTHARTRTHTHITMKTSYLQFVISILISRIAILSIAGEITLRWMPQDIGSGNDMFYFMEKCSFYSYADDNSMPNSAPSVDEVSSNLRHDCQRSLPWLNRNDIEANPNNFQFFMSSSSPNENIEVKISDNVNNTLEPCVKKH